MTAETPEKGAENSTKNGRQGVLRLVTAETPGRAPNSKDRASARDPQHCLNTVHPRKKRGLSAEIAGRDLEGTPRRNFAEWSGLVGLRKGHRRQALH